MQTLPETLLKIQLGNCQNLNYKSKLFLKWWTDTSNFIWKMSFFKKNRKLYGMDFQLSQAKILVKNKKPVSDFYLI